MEYQPSSPTFAGRNSRVDRICSIELQNVKESDTTDDDSSPERLVQPVTKSEILNLKS
jgi:hypothetical protein